MSSVKVDQQRHGYVGGHQLLATSTVLEPRDQSVVDRLSDIGGQPGPNETVPAYLTGYPLPSGKFFALARTWYDYQAPRSGCVLTHTLLIPMEAWSTAGSLRTFTNRHEQFARERSGRPLSPLHVQTEARIAYPPTEAKGLPELCEAIFLEERRPIVWMTEPSDEPAMRLVEALWPALRGRFAFQTYALKPRSKGQGLFDLMVAPRSARSRFSDWDGRRIDGDAPSRHPFTPMLVDSIFQRPYPDLEPADPLGVLRNDQVGDPSKLRLSILWNTLQAAAPDPNKTLSMLDVLSAAGLSRTNRWKLAEPLFRDVFSEAGASGIKGAHLIELALGKLEPEDGGRLSDVIDLSLRRLLRTQPSTALKLSGSSWRDRSVGDVLRHAVADELANGPPELAWAALRDQPVELVSDLIERELELPELLAKHRSEDPSDWSWLSSRLRLLDATERQHIRDGILGQIRSSAQAVLLADLLDDVAADELPTALRQLHVSGGLNDPGIVETFAALPGSTATEKLDAVVRAHIPLSTRHAVFDALLKPRPWAIDWIFRSNLSTKVKAQLLIDVVDQMSRSERHVIASDQNRLDAVIHTLLNAGSGQDLAIQLLREAPRISEDTFEQSLAEFGNQDSDLARALMMSLIERNVPLTDDKDAARLAAVLSVPAGAVAAYTLSRSIVDLLIPERTPNEELTYSLGLAVATGLVGDLRRQFIGNLATVAARAAEYRVYRLAPAAYVCWAQLVAEAVLTDDDAEQSAAESALSYTLRRDFDGTLPLVRASFPVVLRNTYGPTKKARRKAEDLTVKVLRLFLRHRWDGIHFLESLIESGEPEHSFAVASAYSWESERYLSEAAKRFNRRLSDDATQPDGTADRIDDELDFL